MVLERPRGLGPPWRYVGEATTAEGRFPLTAIVGDDGEVLVETSSDAPPGLSGRARLIVRAVSKHTRDGTGEPPRRIARWRADP